MDAKHYDQGDPAFHDASGDRAVEAIVRRHQRWVAEQPAWYQGHFCEHGRYVGFKRTLAYRCPGCPET